MTRQRAEPCTGVAASWCPNCGTCICEARDDGERLVYERCPLHGKASPHPIGHLLR